MTFVESLAELVRLLPRIRELCQRQPTLQEAVVTNNLDPTGLRRVKVSREAQGGQGESDWIPCGRSSSFTDEPIPPPGTACLIGLVAGDPHKPFILRTYSNASNPPDEGQLNPIADDTTVIPGDARRQVQGNQVLAIAGEQDETVEGDCYIKVKGQKYQIDAEFGEVLINAIASGVGRVAIASSLMSEVTSDTAVLLKQGGASLELKGGAMTITTAGGMKWTFGGATGNDWVWDLNGRSVQVINAGGFSINGKQVIVVGSTDSDSDVNNTRGY